MFVLVLVLYVFPAGTASSRGHRDAPAIWALNLLLGWTVIGWIIALVWAFTAPRVEIQIRQVPGAFCIHCGAPRAPGHFCIQCGIRF